MIDLTYSYPRLGFTEDLGKNEDFNNIVYKFHEKIISRQEKN